MNGVFEHRAWSLDELLPYASVLESVFQRSPAPLKPMKQVTSHLAPHPLISDGHVITWYLIQPQFCFHFDGVPMRNMCSSVMYDEERDKWLIVHYYSDQEAPSTLNRCVFELSDPVLNDRGRPMLVQQYNHICWIEQASLPGSFSREKVRILKIASYPQPSNPFGRLYFDAEDMDPVVRSLDVPSRVLDEASYLALTIPLGSVVIFTRSREIHRFRYA